MAPAESDKPPSGEIELDYLGADLPYLSRVLRACIRAENAQFYREFESAQGDIAILNLIGINPGISQNDLAGAVVLKKSAVTKIIKDLEARGLVERRKVSSDKRYNALTLTEAGEEKRRRLRAGMTTQQEQLLSVFGEDERRQFLGQMSRLCAHLTARNKARLSEFGMSDGTDND